MDGKKCEGAGRKEGKQQDERREVPLRRQKERGSSPMATGCVTRNFNLDILETTGC